MKRITLVLMILLLFIMSGCAKKEDNEVAVPDTFIAESPDTPSDTSLSDKSENEESDIDVIQPEEKPSSDMGQNNVIEEDKGTVTESSSSVDVEEDGVIMDVVVNNFGGIISNHFDQYVNFTPDKYQPIVPSEDKESAEGGYSYTEYQPLSTFAVDVDTASYSYFRAMVNAEYEVVSDHIRTEEMINYFDYNYASPLEGEAFAINTELFACPWNKDADLLRIGINTDSVKTETLPPQNLVFLIDVSGSMNSYERIGLVKKSFTMLAENIRPQDKISIVTYASDVQIRCEGISGSETAKITDIVERLQAEGSTYGSGGINTAYDVAKRNFIQDGNNRIILATDGALNVGITEIEQLKDLITEQKKKGIYLSVMGYGMNYKDETLETLADNGNGNYSFIDSEKEAYRVLVREMSSTLFTVAKDAKIQVEFNPKTVYQYKLIGYENRMLENEDFEDDTKDGGEIGAGHSVTALYEIIRTSNRDGEIATVNVRYQSPEGGESKLVTKKVMADEFTDKPSEDSIFAAGVAQVSLTLKDTDPNKEPTYIKIFQKLSTLYCIETDEYKKEFMSLLLNLTSENR